MAISTVSQHGPNPQRAKPDRSVSLSVPDPREIAATMMAHMASGGPGRIGRAAPEGPVPDYEPPSPMSDEERRRGKEWIEKIRRDNEDVLNPESTMASIWGAITAALGGAGAATLPHAQVGQTMMQAARPRIPIPTGGEGWATRPWNMPPIEELPPWPGEIPDVDWPKPPLEWDKIKGDIGGEIEQPGGWEPLPGDEGFNPMDMLGSIFGSVVDAIPDIDPQTAIMVAAAVAAMVAAGTGVGGPLAPVILGGGAALASQ